MNSQVVNVNSCEAENVFVNMHEYRFLRKDDIPEGVKGFYTNNVCECVVGMISSDQGYGFFHYYRECEPERLKEFISRDFTNATSIKITLIGGNPNNLLAPWEVDNRELKFERDDGTTASDEETAQLALNSPHFFRFPTQMGVWIDPTQALMEIIGKYIYKPKNESPLVTYDAICTFDWPQIDIALNGTKIELISYSHKNKGTFGFKTHGKKDFVGYQNLRIVKKICSAFDANLVHFNCGLQADVFFDFDGHLGAKYNFRSKSGGLQTEYIDKKTVFTLPKNRLETLS